VVKRCVVGYSLVVNIVDVRCVYVIHRTVVVEGSMIPISAFITAATVAIAIVHAAIKADMLTPVAAMPDVRVIAPAPVTWSPEIANFRSHHPGSRYPEVTFISVGPIARCPEITVPGRHGLHVHRQRGRSEHDRHSKLSK
jgi:hypothetical protein